MTDCFTCNKEITFLKPGFTKENIQDKKIEAPQGMRNYNLVCGDCFKLIISGEKIPEPPGGFVLEENMNEEKKGKPNITKSGKLLPSEPSLMIWLLPILLGCIGGLIMYLLLKDEDIDRAKLGLYIGIVITIISGVFGIIILWTMLL